MITTLQIIRYKEKFLKASRAWGITYIVPTMQMITDFLSEAIQ